MCFIYLGTSGSFLGFSAGLPLLIQTAFPAVNSIKHTLLGLLVGALTRPFGGWTVSKTGSGTKITQWMFIGVIAATSGVLSFLLSKTQSDSFWGFFACFMVLFALDGIGNGSTFMQILVIFLILHQRWVEQELPDEKQALADAAREGAAVAGSIGTFAAYDGFFIPRSYGTSIVFTGNVNGAFYSFILFYLCYLLLNWRCCARRNAKMKH